MPEAAPLLRLDAVATHIGPYHILHGVDLVVPRECVAGIQQAFHEDSLRKFQAYCRTHTC